MARNAAHFENQGRALWNAGLLIFFGAPRSWQHAAKIRGYHSARDEWRAKHPKTDEWAAASARNAEFCKGAIR